MSSWFVLQPLHTVFRVLQMLRGNEPERAVPDTRRPRFLREFARFLADTLGDLTYNYLTMREQNALDDPKFKPGDKVSTMYSGHKQKLVVVKHLAHPEEYRDCMPHLYEMSNGQILKEFYLTTE